MKLLKLKKFKHNFKIRIFVIFDIFNLETKRNSKTVYSYESDFKINKARKCSSINTEIKNMNAS